MNNDAIEYYKLVISTFDKRLKGRAANAVYCKGGWLRAWEKKLYEEAKRLLKEAQP
jgi:hypothetical protein